MRKTWGGGELMYPASSSLEESQDPGRQIIDGPSSLVIYSLLHTGLKKKR